MYRIGILASTMTPTPNVYKAFEKMNCQLDHLKEVPNFEELHTYDGLLIEEINEGEISSVCSTILRIKQQTNAYVWVLSRKSTLINRQIYLQLGVDGNFDQESFPDEILLYFKNFLSRRDEKKKTQRDVIGERKTTNQMDNERENIEINPKNHSLIVFMGEEGIEIELTRLEYRMFELLYSHPGRAFSYKEIHEKLWQVPYQKENYRVANIVFHVREKLERNGVGADFIKTVRSKGYMIKPENIKGNRLRNNKKR
ncbi:winged helix-turn-helix domain-containing protein [Candidatus Enterococcus ikei]|uniref:Response regulator transcription factor n=1 Tax=Candidatus Enterococcus ikei TaxID=2815326 RepID=A0ABS3GUX3_9ENTE|nr:winged helix-turn-helix domain-containing protein [Enterococcus sp. DIV0869a]MBO0439046.1 response regulator transcription factor [Enterococcus sp. DIV0869a]